MRKHRVMSRCAAILFTCVVLILSTGGVNAQSGASKTASPAAPPAPTPPGPEAAADDSAGGITAEDLVVTGDDSREGEHEQDLSDFEWRTAGGNYVDPTSTFSLHGYVDGVFASKSDDWTAPDPTQLGAPGQLLVPNTPNAAFQYDAALVFGAELGSRAALMLELHLVSNPSGTGTAGPGGLTLALTEATVSWDILPDLLTVSGGIYWAPFGIVNRDWLGAQAVFTLVPRAAGAFPVHWNERGVRINGVVALSDKLAVNYVVSLGNGLNAFNLSGQPSYDLDNNKTLTGRVGVFPGLSNKLEVGVSLAGGGLRNDSIVDPTLGDDNASRYPASWLAAGLDAAYEKGPLLVRGYAIMSTETLNASGSGGAADPADLSRLGATVEAIYEIALNNDIVNAVAPKARLDWVGVDTLTTDGSATNRFTTTVASFGFNVYPGGQDLRFPSYPYRSIYLSFEYHVAIDSADVNASDLDNNRFIARITGRF